MQDLKIVMKKVDELITPDYNPRKISPKRKEEIRQSIEKFGLVQPFVVNVNPERMNYIVGGNGRNKIVKQMGYDEVPCIEVCLDEEGEKELNLRLNKNQGEFDYEALKSFFNNSMLSEVGFSEKEIGKVESDFDKRFNEVNNDNCAMPIVPKFNEKYGCIIITFANELDETFLLNFLHLESAKDYKNKRIGVPYVINVKDFQKIIEEYGK